jgi:hypothetical protein
VYAIKEKLTGIDYRYRLQSLLTDYKRPQKVRHRLRSLLIDYESWTYTSKFTNRLQMTTKARKFPNRLQKTTNVAHRLQSLVIEYKRLQKVRHRLQSLLIDYKRLHYIGHPLEKFVVSAFWRLQKCVVCFSDMCFVVSLTMYMFMGIWLKDSDYLTPCHCCIIVWD